MAIIACIVFIASCEKDDESITTEAAERVPIAIYGLDTAALFPELKCFGASGETKDIPCSFSHNELIYQGKSISPIEEIHIYNDSSVFYSIFRNEMLYLDGGIVETYADKLYFYNP